MFSTNLPTETLYKTCFTLGLILLVFTLTMRVNKELELKKNNLEFEYSLKNKKLIDSLELQKVKQNIKKLQSYNKELKENGLLLDKYGKFFTIDDLKKNKKYIDSLNHSYDFIKDKNDSLLSNLMLDNIEQEKNFDKLNIEFNDINEIYNSYFIWLLILSIFLIVFGFIMWRKMQLISDRTAKLNLEKIELEVENLKLSQKRYNVNKPLSENEECNND